MSALVLHVIKEMKFQVANITITFNKTNCDHLIYKPHDTHKVFENINSKDLRLKFGSNFCLCVTNFGLGLVLQED